jgi:hypothetical protein
MSLHFPRRETDASVISSLKLTPMVSAFQAQANSMSSVSIRLGPRSLYVLKNRCRGATSRPNQSHIMPKVSASASST